MSQQRRSSDNLAGQLPSRSTGTSSEAESSARWTARPTDAGFRNRRRRCFHSDRWVPASGSRGERKRAGRGRPAAPATWPQGAGAVYKALHIPTLRLCAVKVVPVHDKVHRQQLISEVMALRQNW